MQRRIVGLDDKMPDIQKTLETVRFLKSRKVGLCIDSKVRNSRVIKTDHLISPVQIRLRLHLN